MDSQSFGHLFGGLTRARDARSGRASSWDHSGRNMDNWVLPPGGSAVLADIEGPGCLTHIWMTQCAREILGPSSIPPVDLPLLMTEMHNGIGLNFERNDPDYYRKVLLKIYWDDQDHPSVLVPLGDFFCLGHSIASNFASLPFTASVRDQDRLTFGGGAALNCYLPMPFQKRARVEIENQNDKPYVQYFYIDYELYRQPLPDDTVYLHAQWRRENPCEGWGPEIQVNSPESAVANLDGRGNYTILDAEGRGHYIGCNLSVTHFQNSWWGEGDDMIFIDGEGWPPSLHGTGSEDYFTHAWGMQRNAYPMSGSVVYEGDLPGYQVSYRFHLVDPVHFSRSIRVTMEHGHANQLSDDWASTAYWYQTLPSTPFSILPVAERLPIHLGGGPLAPLRLHDTPAPVEMTDEARAMKTRYHERYAQYLTAREEVANRRVEQSLEHARANLEQAKRTRDAFR